MEAANLGDLSSVTEQLGWHCLNQFESIFIILCVCMCVWGVYALLLSFLLNKLLNEWNLASPAGL